MSRRGPWRSRALALAVAATASAAMVAGAVSASGGRDALAPTRKPADQNIEKRVDRLLGRMTLEEKLEQIQLLADNQVTDDDAKKGVGGSLQPHRPGEDQRAAAHRRGAVAAAHPDPVRLRHDPRVQDDLPDPARRRPRASIRTSRPPTTRSPRASRDASASSRSTARWSTSRTSRGGAGSPRARARTRTSARFMAATRVRAAQGSDYSAPDKVVTSPKHLAAYGQPEGGREYNTTDMSEQRLRNMYLPPFKAAVDAGADTSMCSFNAINGVPGARTPRPRRTSSSTSGASTASSRATTPRSPSCAPARR